MANKKILIITYYWPPAGGAGVQRWLKFVKYLPDFNIEPLVVTVHPSMAEYPQKDESLLKDIAKDLKIYTTNSKSVYNLYKKFTHSKTAPYGGFANEANPSFKQKISRFIRGNFFLPDPRREWNKYAYQQVIHLIKEYSIDTVITTGPPNSTHLIGLKLKRNIHNIKWIADFRDPWTDLYYNKLLYQTFIAKAIDRKLERTVLLKADTVITVSKNLKKLLTEKSTLIQPEKIQVITNGYDENDYSTDVEKEKIFTITYTGTLAASYPISDFLEAAAQLTKTTSFKLQFIGKIDETIKKKAESLLKEVVVFIPYVEHKESVRYLQKSHLLLAILPDVNGNKSYLPGKIFEYIGANTPIISLGPLDGNTAEVIRACNAGQTFDYNDIQGIKGYIEKCNSDFIKNVKPLHNEATRLFSRKALTERLSQIL